MSAPLVVTRREDALLYVGINRPEKRNALHRGVLDALVAAVAAAEGDPAVRAIVVYGEGPVFSAGVDFTALAGDVGGETREPFRTVIAGLQGAISRLEAIEKPVIGALHRYVPGLGLELALAFDCRVATADCELGLPEVRLGLVPDVGGTTRLVRTVGYAKAKELILTGRMIPADEARAIGLVNAVVPPGEHLAAATRLAQEIAANAPLAVGSPSASSTSAPTSTRTPSFSSSSSPRASCSRPRTRRRACGRRRSGAHPASKGADGAAVRPWNVLATALEGRRAALLAALRPLGAFGGGGYRNVLVGLVPDTAAFLERVRDALAADRLLPTALARIVPVE